MFYAHEVRNCCVLAIFERRRGRLGSKISGLVNWRKWRFTSPCPVDLRKQTPIGRVGMSVVGPGCVKTHLSEECAELFSQLPPSDRRSEYNSFSDRRNREEAPTSKLTFRVFTQPGSSTDVPGHGQRGPRYPNSGHRLSRLPGYFSVGSMTTRSRGTMRYAA